MKTTRFFRPALCCLLGLLALTACKPELDYVVDSFRSSQATLSGSGETITVLFTSDAGTASIDLSASGAWTAEFVNGRAYWCKLSQTEGKRGVATLTFTVDSNGEYDERSASVVFTSGELRRTVVVVQKQRDAMLLSSGRLEIDADGGTLAVELSANVDFTHTIDAAASGWIHVLGTKGLRQSQVVFSIDKNPSLERRSGNITFSGAAGSETVTVYQKGEVPTIVVSEPEVMLNAEEGIVRVEIASNLDVTFEVDQDCDWLEEVRTRTISTRTYTFAYTRNHSRKPRQSFIVFRNEEFGKQETVWIEQVPAEILIEPWNVYVPSFGETIAVQTVGEVGSFDLFRFESDWPEAVSVEPYEGGNRFLLKVAPNPTPFMRITGCTIYREGFDEPDRVEIVQYSQQPSYEYETTLREVSVPEMKGVVDGAVVIWGDGNYDLYEEGITHTYAEAGTHTIRIEGGILPYLLIPNPQNGMHYDFTNLRKRF